MNLNTNDLIIEYIIYKIKNGYEPSFTEKEFLDFLDYSKNTLNITFDKKKVFQDFFKSDLSVGLEKWKDSFFATYQLGCFETSIINTYFMSTNEQSKIRNIIADYLSKTPKREIDFANSPYNNSDLEVGYDIAAIFVDIIWNNIVNRKINSGLWPYQCNDIFEYFFENDLASTIHVDIKKDELFRMYEDIAKKIAIMCTYDRYLEISTYNNTFLSHANYLLLKQGYEELFDENIGGYNTGLHFNISSLNSETFMRYSDMPFRVKYLDGTEACHNKEIEITDNSRVKKLVRSLDLTINK